MAVVAVAVPGAVGTEMQAVGTETQAVVGIQGTGTVAGIAGIEMWVVSAVAVGKAVLAH